MGTQRYIKRNDFNSFHSFRPGVDDDQTWQRHEVGMCLSSFHLHLFSLSYLPNVPTVHPRLPRDDRFLRTFPSHIQKYLTRRAFSHIQTYVGYFMFVVSIHIYYLLKVCLCILLKVPQKELQIKITYMLVCIHVQNFFSLPL